MRVEMTRREAKGRAAALRERLRKAGIEARLGLCYELLAAACGEDSWNVLSARIEVRDRETDPWPARAGSLARLRRAAGRAGLQAAEADRIARHVERCAGTQVDGAHADRDLDMARGEFGLVVPLCADHWRAGRLLHYVADRQGRVAPMKGHRGHMGNHEMLGNPHPRSWFLRQSMRMFAVCPDDGLSLPEWDAVRGEVADTLLDQASSAILTFVRRHAPEGAAFAERVRCWIPEVLDEACSRPDPDRFVARTRRFHWAMGLVCGHAPAAADAAGPAGAPDPAPGSAPPRGWLVEHRDTGDWTGGLGDPDPGAHGVAGVRRRLDAAMDAFERDPGGTVRSALAAAAEARRLPELGLRPEDVRLLAGSPWREPVADVGFREAACARQAAEETLLWHLLDLRHPGLLPDDERGLAGCMRHLAPFSGLRRGLDRRDLVGLREAVDRLEWGHVHGGLRMFRSLSPDAAYAQWTFAEAAGFVFGLWVGPNVRAAMAAAGAPDPRPRHHGDRERGAFGERAALRMAEDRPVPEVVGFVGDALRLLAPYAGVAFDREDAVRRGISVHGEAQRVAKDALLRALPLYAEAERAVLEADAGSGGGR